MPDLNIHVPCRTDQVHDCYTAGKQLCCMQALITLLASCFLLNIFSSAIIGTWHEKGASTFWNSLGRMALPSQVIMCWKAMLVIHKLLREGHPNVSITSVGL